jgi:hypothetical protein
MSIKKIKRNLIEEKGYKCETCHIADWNNLSICLEMDHIDGNNLNNHPTNLRLLCPNCHSQTSTFRGRNINGKSKVSDDDLYKALIETENIRQALIKVGLTPKSDNYTRAYAILNGIYERPCQITNSQYNTCWINNGIINKKVKKNILDEHTSLGWKLGRIVHKKPPSIKGKFWVTNGAINKMVDKIPKGFWKGKVQA